MPHELTIVFDQKLVIMESEKLAVCWTRKRKQTLSPSARLHAWKLGIISSRVQPSCNRLRRVFPVDRTLTSIMKDKPGVEWGRTAPEWYSAEVFGTLLSRSIPPMLVWLRCRLVEGNMLWIDIWADEWMEGLNESWDMKTGNARLVNGVRDGVMV